MARAMSPRSSIFDLFTKIEPLFWSLVKLDLEVNGAINTDKRAVMTAWAPVSRGPII